MDNKNDTNILSKKINDIFKENINISHVSKHSVLIVTKEDKCYEFKRSDTKNLFIVSSNNMASIKSLIEEVLVKELCNRQVIDFKTGLFHSIALTKDGKAYYWDLDYEGIFGEELRASGRNKYKPVLVKEKVKDIHCGSRHTLILTTDHEIFAFGYNNFGQIGNNSKKYQETPLKLNGFDGKNIVAICCGSEHSLALTESCEVYSWGRNDCGQLGISNEFKSHSPNLVKLGEEVKIEKMSCGKEYSLLLSCDGDIYVCGWKALRSFGISDQKVITKLIHKEKFRDIVSHSLYSISAAHSQESCFYIWGKCEGEEIKEPKNNRFKSFDDIFEHYLRITCKPTAGKVIKFNDNSIQNGKYENDFKEKRCIEEDSYGEVFEINDNDLKRNYKIKKMKTLAKYEKEFLKELVVFPIISKLSNEHIIKYFDVWLENDSNGNLEKEENSFSLNFLLYIQLEICDKSLKTIIDEIRSDSNFCLNKTLTPIGYFIASEIFIEILEGVNYLHNQSPRLIHRVLNPWNIMFKIEEQSNNSIKIKGFQNIETDFGTSAIDNKVDIRDLRFFEYLAPEVHESMKSSSKTDIYSLGVVIQKLFAINIDRDNEIRNGTHSDDLNEKYRNLRNLYDRMTQRLVYKRPVDIEVIIEEKPLWTLNSEKFNFKKEFEKVSISNQSNTSFVFKLLEKKLLFTNKPNSIPKKNHEKKLHNGKEKHLEREIPSNNLVR